MKLFHIIEDTQVIKRSRGVFSQVPLFRRGSELFAKHGGGFIRLMARGTTSTPNVSWIDMDDHREVVKTGGHCNAPVCKGDV